MGPPRIVTARLDPASQALLDGLREAHFPAARNVLAAHLTLLHAVPDAHADACHAHVAALCRDGAPLPLALPRLRRLGRGVAVQVACAPLQALHRRLQAALAPALGAQDRQPLWPHVTVANKLPAAAARLLFVQLQAAWSPREGAVCGLDVWRYLDGPWAHEAGYRLGA